MSIALSGYRFDGVYSSTSSLHNRSGVYAILTPTDSTHYRVLDVGESATVRTRIENHDRKPCWHRYANRRQLRYAAYYTPRAQQPGRQAVEQRIRRQYHPPCGSL